MTRRTRGSLVLAALIASGPLLAGGCAAVRPWERELVSHPAMAEELDPGGAAFDGHVAGARESALDPAESGGGGCGCN